MKRIFNWFIPPPLKRFDEFLLQNHPAVWRTRGHFVFIYSILASLLLFISGYFYQSFATQILVPPIATIVIYTEPYFYVSLVFVVIAIAYWAYTQIRIPFLPFQLKEITQTILIYFIGLFLLLGINTTAFRLGTIAQIAYKVSDQKIAELRGKGLFRYGFFSAGDSLYKQDPLLYYREGEKAFQKFLEGEDQLLSKRYDIPFIDSLSNLLFTDSTSDRYTSFHLFQERYRYLPRLSYYSCFLNNFFYNLYLKERQFQRFRKERQFQQFRMEGLGRQERLNRLDRQFQQERLERQYLQTRLDWLNQVKQWQEPQEQWQKYERYLEFLEQNDLLFLPALFSSSVKSKVQFQMIRITQQVLMEKNYLKYSQERTKLLQEKAELLQGQQYWMELQELKFLPEMQEHPKQELELLFQIFQMEQQGKMQQLEEEEFQKLEEFLQQLEKRGRLDQLYIQNWLYWLRQIHYYDSFYQSVILPQIDSTILNQFSKQKLLSDSIFIVTRVNQNPRKQTYFIEQLINVVQNAKLYLDGWIVGRYYKALSNYLFFFCFLFFAIRQLSFIGLLSNLLIYIGNFLLYLFLFSLEDSAQFSPSLFSLNVVYLTIPIISFFILLISILQKQYAPLANFAIQAFSVAGIAILFFSIFGEPNSFPKPPEFAFFSLQILSLFAAILVSYIVSLPKRQ